MFGFRIQAAGIKKVPLNSRVEEGRLNNDCKVCLQQKVVEVRTLNVLNK